MKNYAKLPFQFDVPRLQEELMICTASWTKHFNTDYYSGEWSGISLRSAKGENHSISAGNAGSAEFADEPVLDLLTYTRQVLNTIRAPKNVVRYLRLTPGSQIKAHKDYDLAFWDGQARLHIPIATNDQVEFLLDDQLLNMKEGECWFADFSKTHSVINRGKTDRVHLVIDCLVNDWLRDVLVEAGVLAVGEQAPKEIDKYDNATKQLIIEQLKAQGTAKALELAEQIKKTM